MGINTDIWGATETWVSFTTYANGEVKTPAKEKDSYFKQWNTGGIELNNTDLSSCFWGVGKNSIWATPFLVAAYAANGDLSDIQFEKRRISNNKDMPLLFTLGTTSSTELPRYTRRYKPDTTTSDVNNNFYTFPIVTSFNYQKVLVIPVVHVAKSDFSSSQYPILYSYLNNPTQMKNYPYIVGIAYHMYMSEAGTRTQNSYVSGLRPYMFRDVDGSPGYENKLFFARSGGISYGNVSAANNYGANLTNIFASENGLSANYGIITPNATVSDPDTAIRYKYSVDSAQSNGAIVPIYYIDDNWKIGLNGNWRCVAYLDTADYTIEEIKNYVFKQIAFLGLPFVYDYQTYYNGAIGDEGVYLPVFDEYGVTTGEYAEGDAALAQRNSEWIDGRDSGFDPNRPPTPGGEDRGDLTNSYANRYTNAGGLSQYVVSEEEVIKLAAFLNGRYLPTAADLDADFKGTNPQQYVVSVQKYPFSLPNSGGTADIYVGQQNTGIEGKPLFATFGQIGVLPINNPSTFDFGTIDLSNPEYMSGNFLDYQKKLLLYMPFVGTEELDPRLYFGHVLGLVYRIDYNTGAVAAEIKRDGLTIETKTSTISITIPFMAADMGSFQNQLAQLSYAKDLAKIKGAGAALSAGFTMAAGAQGTMSAGQPPLSALANLAQSGVQLAANATQLSQLDYQIEHTAPNVGTISTAAAANAFFMDARARLVVVFPSMLPGYNAKEYSHIIGNACCKTGNLGSFSGFTVCSTADLSGVTTKGSIARIPTEAEKELIRKVLLTGIYL